MTTTPAITAHNLHISLPITMMTTSAIGFIFTILCLVRYFRKKETRTHFSYMFHTSLFYCILQGLVVVPIMLTGYYFHVFDSNRAYCHLLFILVTTALIGLPTSIAWASVERNIFIFQINRKLTLRREILPSVLIFFGSLISSVMLNLIPQCHYTPCTPCILQKLYLVLIGSTLNFLVPVVTMILSTLIFLWRLYIKQRHRAIGREGMLKSVKQHKWQRPMRRVAIQMVIYVIWSLCYCLPNLVYNLLSIVNAKKYLSATAGSVITIVAIAGVQTYPLLTFIQYIPRASGRKCARATECEPRSMPENGTKSAKTDNI